MVLKTDIRDVKSRKAVSRTSLESCNVTLPNKESHSADQNVVTFQLKHKHPVLLTSLNND